MLARHDIHGSHGALGGGSLVEIFFFFFFFPHFFLSIVIGLEWRAVMYVLGWEK